MASDGSLLVVDETKNIPALRALVPNASPRLRLAFLPATWRAFARGRLDYIASAAGKLDILVRNARGRTVLQQGDSTPAGADTLRLRRALRRGVYDVRLTLTTSSGTRTRARARIFTITTLSFGDARRALRRDFDNSDGDALDGGATEIGKRCVRRNRRRVACRLSAYDVEAGEVTRHTCRGWTVAQLHPDRIRTTTDNLNC